MKYNIEKINGIAERLAEIIEEAIVEEGQAEIKIGAVEMVLRESLREIGEKALVCILENADKEWEGVSRIECTCGLLGCVELFLRLVWWLLVSILYSKISGLMVVSAETAKTGRQCQLMNGVQRVV